MHELEKQQTQLFPCASKVNIPAFIGGKERSADVTITPRSLSSLKQQTLGKQSSLQQVGLDLTFGEDVLRERCFHLLPYSDKYFYEAIDPSNVVKIPEKSRAPIGRHNKRGIDNRHMPCHFKKKSPRLKPLKDEIMKKALELHKKALLNSEQSKNEVLVDSPKKEETTEKLPPTFLTENKEENYPDYLKPLDKADWDQYLLSAISRNTAFWLVNERLPRNDNQDRLLKTLKQWYGSSAPTGTTELVSDEISEVEFSLEKKAELKEEKDTWKRKEDVLLEELGIKKPVGATDPYSDKNNATFYRLPAGLRKQKKKEEKLDAGSVNKTAAKIEVMPRESTPPPSLLDFINPKVGEKMFKTENMYEQEWLSGIGQIHQKPGQDILVMESSNRYQKILQPEFPPVPEGWFPPTTDEVKKDSDSSQKTKRLEKGLHRWKSLPEPIDDRAGLQIGTGDLDQQRFIDQDAKDHVKKNATLLKIIEDWQNKWFLTQQFADATPDELIRDMMDLHPHVRLKAIMTCARAIDYRPPQEKNEIKFGETDVVNAVEKLPEKIFTAMKFCLNDNHIRVQIAAAITLYTLGKANDKALSVLRRALNDENSIDRWAAAQCLAHHGVCDSDVVGELIHQLMHSEDLIRYEQSVQLLTKLSLDISNSSLVYSMLAEQLNSSSWRHKIIACKTIPIMTGEVTKDLVNKLANLMWNDWHADVRIAAAQCLGKTGHGKDVHDDLRSKLTDPDERVRTDALNKVGHLGIMTAKLMPSFLSCFQDEYVSVRMELCIACSNLLMKDENVIAKLTHLASYDPIWKVKALAIQALGKIGIHTPQIHECVLWALRYEKEAAIRAEACHTIYMLKIKDEITAEILQDRYLVESSNIVKEEIALALGMFGISPTEDMDTVTQIKEEVRKLCTLSNISSQILAKEEHDEHKHNFKRLIHQQKSKVQEETIASSAASDGRRDQVPSSAASHRSKKESTAEIVTKRKTAVYQKPLPTTDAKPKTPVSPKPTTPEKSSSSPKPQTPSSPKPTTPEITDDSHKTVVSLVDEEDGTLVRELTKITEKDETTTPFKAERDDKSITPISKHQQENIVEDVGDDGVPLVAEVEQIQGEVQPSRPSTTGDESLFDKSFTSAYTVQTRPSTGESEMSIRPSTRSRDSGSRSITFMASTPGPDNELYHAESASLHRQSTKESLHEDEFDGQRSLSRIKSMVTPRPSISRKSSSRQSASSRRKLKFHYDMATDDIVGLDLERVPTTLVQLYVDADHPERGPPKQLIPTPPISAKPQTNVKDQVDKISDSDNECDSEIEISLAKRNKDNIVNKTDFEELETSSKEDEEIGRIVDTVLTSARTAEESALSASRLGVSVEGEDAAPENIV